MENLHSEFSQNYSEEGNVYLAKIKYEGGITVLLVHLAVEEDYLPPGDDHVQLLPSVPPDILLARSLQPTLQASLGVPQLRLCPN